MSQETRRILRLLFVALVVFLVTGISRLEMDSEQWMIDLLQTEVGDDSEKIFTYHNLIVQIPRSVEPEALLEIFSYIESAYPRANPKFSATPWSLVGGVDGRFEYIVDLEEGPGQIGVLEDYIDAYPVLRERFLKDDTWNIFFEFETQEDGRYFLGETKAALSQYSVSYKGQISSQLHILDQITRDIVLFLVLLITSVPAALAVLTGRKYNWTYFLVLVLSAMATTLGIMGWLGLALSNFSIIIPIMAVTIALPAHYHLSLAQRDGTSLFITQKHISITLLTTGAAFLPMLFQSWQQLQMTGTILIILCSLIICSIWLFHPFTAAPTRGGTLVVPGPRLSWFVWVFALVFSILVVGMNGIDQTPMIAAEEQGSTIPYVSFELSSSNPGEALSEENSGIARSMVSDIEQLSPAIEVQWIDPYAQFLRRQLFGERDGGSVLLQTIEALELSRSTPLGDSLINRYIDLDYQHLSFTLLMPISNPMSSSSSYAELEKKILSLLSEKDLGNLTVSNFHGEVLATIVDVQDTIFSDQVVSYGWFLALLSIISFLVLRRPSFSLPPMATGFAILCFFGWRIAFFGDASLIDGTLIAILLGISSDDMMYLQLQKQRGHRTDHGREAVVGSSLVFVIAFAPLLASSYLPLAQGSLAIMVSLLSTTAFTLWSAQKTRRK